VTSDKFRERRPPRPRKGYRLEAGRFSRGGGRVGLVFPEEENMAERGEGGWVLVSKKKSLLAIKKRAD